jgi:hypothetical protein
MTYTTKAFSVDEIGFIQTALTRVLAAVSRGEVDLNRLAREEIASRGLDQEGVWVGFERAAAALQGTPTQKEADSTITNNAQ